jgi:hypothetical protein
MGSFINITSNNFSGETAEVYFMPCSGGTLQNFGSSPLPIDIADLSEYPASTYGLYQVYLTDFSNQLCEVEYNCPGPGYPFFKGDSNLGFTNAIDACSSGGIDELIYSNANSVSVGDTLYLDNAMTLPYSVGVNFYASLKYSQYNFEAKYALKTDNNGVITEIIDCVTLLGTPTPTPTVDIGTPTPTNAPTSTPTPTPAFSAFNISTAGVSELDACTLTSTLTAYSNGSTPPVLGDTVYANNNGTGTYSAGFYKNNYDQVFELDGSGVVIAGPNSCS